MIRNREFYSWAPAPANQTHDPWILPTSSTPPPSHPHPSAGRLAVQFLVIIPSPGQPLSPLPGELLLILHSPLQGHLLREALPDVHQVSPTRATLPWWV